MRIGGFNPLLTGPEDIDLLRRVLLEEEVAETKKTIALISMGGEGSTTDYAHHPQASRWAREDILEKTNAQRRMRLSAIDPLWKGRMLRIYLTSVVWNIQHRRLFTAANRAFTSLASLFYSGTDVFSKNLWRAVSKPYASITFEKGIQDARNAK
jgi:hypothetical protein